MAHNALGIKCNTFLKGIETGELSQKDSDNYSLQYSSFLLRKLFAKRRMFITCTNLANGNRPSKNNCF